MSSHVHSEEVPKRMQMRAADQSTAEPVPSIRGLARYTALHHAGHFAVIPLRGFGGSGMYHVERPSPGHRAPSSHLIP